jgi:predicted PurR-regulated permease PerM
MTGPATEPSLPSTPGAPEVRRAPDTPGATGGDEAVAAPGATNVVILFDRRNVWRTGLVLAAVVALAAFVKWVIDDGGSVIFTLIMSMLAAIAMEPAVARLSQRMRRGVATILVMVGVLLFTIVFLLAFGRLLGEQLATFVRSIPALVDRAVAWANETFGVSLSVQSLLEQFTGSTAGLAKVAGDLAGGLIGVIAAVLGAFFGSITFFFFTFYFSADSARLRTWVARLVPPKQQEVFNVAWDLAVIKTGGYVSARLVLAAICGGLSSLFMLIIGMPYWLALGLWTGLVAQFVPTIGTYIAIALPVFVGLVGPEPWQGLALLAFALVYQQIENVTIEPRISAEAVDVHPAVSFAAVMFGAALFGVAGAFVAVPVAALMLALFGIYSRKYDLVPELAALEAAKRDKQKKAKRNNPKSATGGASGTSGGETPGLASAAETP